MTTEKTTTATTTLKEIQTMTAAIGSSLTAADKLAAITIAKETASPVLKVVLNDYIHAMRTTANAKTVKAAGLPEEDTTAFMFSAGCLYRAAINAANLQHKETDAKKANNALFAEWKGFLSLLAGDTVKAAASDRETLVSIASRRVKEAISYKARTNQAGELTASIDMGVTHSSANSFNAFMKEAERLAVERIMGFDGIVSMSTTKSIREANSGLKEAALTLATNGVKLEKAS